MPSDVKHRVSYGAVLRASGSRVVPAPCPSPGRGVAVRFGRRRVGGAETGQASGEWEAQQVGGFRPLRRVEAAVLAVGASIRRVVGRWAGFVPQRRPGRVYAGDGSGLGHDRTGAGRGGIASLLGDRGRSYVSLRATSRSVMMRRQRSMRVRTRLSLWAAAYLGQRCRASAAVPLNVRRS